jgi:hypothetical protein
MSKTIKLLIVIPAAVILTFALILGVIADFDIFVTQSNNHYSRNPNVPTSTTSIPEAGSVSGYVFESDNISPIAGATVSIYRVTSISDHLEFSSNTVTNIDGR